MRRLLKICEEYGAEFSVTFNASKSAWMYITKHGRPLSSDVQFCVDGKYIPYVMQYSHLGHVISADMNDKQDILNRRNAVCGKLNNLLCHFWKCDPFVKSKLLRNFCCDFYGSCLWDLSHSSIADLTVAWRKGLRRLWGLPYRTHSVLLAPLCGMLPLESELMCRSVNFMCKCLGSCNEVVSFAARNGIYVQRMTSPIGRNAQWCCDNVGVSLYNIHSISRDLTMQCVSLYSSLPDWVVTSVNMIYELLLVRWNRMCLQLLNSYELDCIVEAVCTG